MKKILYFLFYLLIFLSPSFVYAQEIAETIQVQAFVESNVSKDQSAIEADKTEILADKSNVVIVTVYARDKEGKSLANKVVTLYSNRGEVDTIEAVTNQTIGLVDRAYAAQGSGSAKTDKQGIARFKVSSDVAGKATFKTIVDGYIELDPIKITFNGLPFPSSLTIIVSTPSFWGLIPSKLITLFKPAQEAEEVVNTGVNVNIPFMLLLIIIILIGLTIFFPLNNYFVLRRAKKTEKKHYDILAQALVLLRDHKLDGKLEVDGELRKELDGRLKNR